MGQTSSLRTKRGQKRKGGEKVSSCALPVRGPGQLCGSPDLPRPRPRGSPSRAEPAAACKASSVAESWLPGKGGGL